MTRPDATTPLTDALAAHVGWPLAFTALLAVLVLAALIIRHIWLATARGVDTELEQTEYEAWARPVTVHHGDKPLPRLRIDDDTARRWIQAAEAMERAGIEDTVRQAEDYLADRPYNQEEDPTP